MKMKKAVVIAVTFFFLACLLAAGYGYLKYMAMTEKWYEPLREQPESQACCEDENPVENEKKEDLKEEKKEIVYLEPFNMMIVGVDKRKGEKLARSDTIMLASVNPQLQKVMLLSIPRDTLAKIPGHGLDKFNHSMFYGGAPLVKQTMEQFFGINIHHYVAVDFEGFVQIVDKLGGIEVHVERRMKYSDPADGTFIDLKPGIQVLNGKQALDYARFRKSDIGSDSSDFDRMKRQQEVIRQIADKATDFTSVFKMFAMMDILGEHIKTDFKEEDIRKLAVLFKDFSSSGITSEELKGTNKRIPMHGYQLWVYMVSDEEKDRIRGIVEDTISENIKSSAEPVVQ